MNLWVFDNDGTLYDDFGAGQQFMKIFYEYYAESYGNRSGCMVEEVDNLKDKWNTEFSILALMKEYGVDFERIVQETYLKINLQSCNIPSPDLARLEAINSLQGRKVVLTNNPSVFAKRVLSFVGLEQCFMSIIGMEETQFLGKPDAHAYRTVERLYPGFDRILFCDDSLKNLDGARALGWTTIWCKPKSADAQAGAGHIVINSFQELKQIE